MYTDFFQLREEPFQVTPNPRYLFLSTVHREAVQRLTDGVRRRKGFIELVGMAGTGKTLLCKELIQMLSPEMDIAYLFYPVLNEQALYSSILKQWGEVEVDENTPVPALLERISAFLRGRFARGRNALIILDEAQNLSLPLLENLRLLSNLETDSEKLLQILLSGQPEFHALLKSGKIPQLDQRIRVRVFLKALDRQTLPLYVYHRINTAGGGNLIEFTEDGFDLIYRLSNGIPRMINTVCERALEEACRRKTFRINAAIVRETRENFEGGPWSEGIGKGRFFVRFPTYYRVGLGALMVVFLGFTLWFMVRTVNRGDRAPKNPTSGSAQATLSSRRERGRVQRLNRDKPLVRPLKPMEHFLAGMLPIPGGMSLSWGEMRLGSRDLKAMRTPVLLYVVDGTERKGWLCARYVRNQGLQVWSRDGWANGEPALLDQWTGRCRVPFWMEGWDRRKRALRPDDEGPSVVHLQSWLQGVGLGIRVTGNYDAQTQSAVRQFQLQEGLKPDGVAGHQTLALLFQMGKGKTSLGDFTGGKHRGR